MVYISDDLNKFNIKGQVGGNEHRHTFGIYLEIFADILVYETEEGCILKKTFIIII